MEKVNYNLKQDVVITLHGEEFNGTFITFDCYLFKTDTPISVNASTKVMIDEEEGTVQAISFLGNTTFAVQVCWD